ncbi:hypothetical protein [Yersinia rochesterensis]|uniref:hypothetical protein n=1 Tax=Yersinia rochesterensis TaxID=1604335 RepID=UPI0011A98C27|nr:hypothetical protein [Yersinia rochesterensis]
MHESSQQRYGAKQQRECYSKSLVLQQGGKRVNPDELTPVNDSGAREQPTTLRCQATTRVLLKVIGVAARRQTSKSR